MGFLIDTHLHTARHSGCSRIPAEMLIQQAVQAGLHGLIITEHHYQWSVEELETLRQAADEPSFLLMAGFEYTSSCGDILVYGLPDGVYESYQPYEDTQTVLRAFQQQGAFCVAAHPTRAGMGFSEDIARMPLDAIEVRSVNMQAHEQRLAERLGQALGARTVAASDAHRAADVGRYALEFDAPVRHMADFIGKLRQNTYRLSGPRH